MRIHIPKIIRPLPLREYAPELVETSLHVWANPPRDMLARRYELMRLSAQAQEQLGGEGDAQAAKTLEQVGEELIAWYAEVWSQGDPSTHISPDDIRAMIAELNDTDPGLWSWMTVRTLELIAEHRTGQKKR